MPATYIPEPGPGGSILLRVLGGVLQPHGGERGSVCFFTGRVVMATISFDMVSVGAEWHCSEKLPDLGTSVLGLFQYWDADNNRFYSCMQQCIYFDDDDLYGWYYERGGYNSKQGFTLNQKKCESKPRFWADITCTVDSQESYDPAT